MNYAFAPQHSFIAVSSVCCKRCNDIIFPDEHSSTFQRLIPRVHKLIPVSDITMLSGSARNAW